MDKLPYLFYNRHNDKVTRSCRMNYMVMYQEQERREMNNSLLIDCEPIERETVLETMARDYIKAITLD